MHKIVNTAVALLAAGIFMLGSSQAQNTPAATTSTPSAAQAAPAKTPAAATKPKTGTAAKTAAAPLTLKTQKEKFSYAIGMKMGQNFKKQSVSIDPAMVARGMRDATTGTKTLLTDEQAQAAIMDMQKDMRAKMEEKSKEEAVGNKKEGEAFLAANKSKDGVKVLPDGLQYKILKEGNGAKPTSEDKVSVNYRGTLINGKEFDSSYKRGQPISFPVTGVIKGWTEALQMMPVGSKWQLFIPSDLAYGDRGAGGDIGPGDTLIFEVELLGIEPKDKPADEKKQ